MAALKTPPAAAGRLPVHTVLDAVRQASNQRGALPAPGIDDGVILYRLNGLAKGLMLGFDRRGEPGFAPAAIATRISRSTLSCQEGISRNNQPSQADAGDSLQRRRLAGSVCSTPVEEVLTINTRIR